MYGTFKDHACNGNGCLRCWSNKLKHQNKECKRWLRKHPDRFCKSFQVEDYGSCKNDITIDSKRMERFTKRFQLHPGWKIYVQEHSDYSQQYEKWLESLGSRIPNNSDIRTFLYYM